MKWEQVVALGRELPEVVLDIWFRTPALKVRGKSFCRLKEDGKDVVFILESVDEQEALCAAMPAIYYITDHYRGYPAVLARLAKLRVPECRVRLERGWRMKAPKQLLNDPVARIVPTTKRAPTKQQAAPTRKRVKTRSRR